MSFDSLNLLQDLNIDNKNQNYKIIVKVFKCKIPYFSEVFTGMIMNIDDVKFHENIVLTLISPFLISPYLISPYLISPYLISPYLISPYLDGHVHTPRHGHLWNISKAQLQISDGFAGQVLEHLMKTHLRMEPFCVALQRHLSSLHPLHQIMKHHCRGLLPLNARGAVTLLEEERTIRSLFGYGNRGAMNLLRNEYPKMVWGDIDLEANIRVSKTLKCDFIMLPYN